MKVPLPTSNLFLIEFPILVKSVLGALYSFLCTWRNAVRTAIIVTVLTFLLSACGGGGGGGSQTSVPDEPTQVTVPNRPTRVTTIQTYEFGGLIPEAFRQKRAELAEDIKGEESFKEQWGLKAINAHQAYANLRLAKGPDARPGYGTTVSFVDSGVNEDDPSLSSFFS